LHNIPPTEVDILDEEQEEDNDEEDEGEGRRIRRQKTWRSEKD
jgi:hypothetical protein